MQVFQMAMQPMLDFSRESPGLVDVPISRQEGQVEIPRDGP